MANYLRNAWYAAANGDELKAAPLSRVLLGEPLVFYRTETGAVVALQDRCPHRFAPLSMGKIRGDQLECPYHGLRFDRTGACSHNPHGTIPAKATVRSYPTLERFGYIWFWPGNPEQADSALLPDFPFMRDAEHFTVAGGYLHVKANYELIVDNLLDLSHALFVHPHFNIPGQSAADQLRATETKTTTTEKSITAWRLRRGLPPNPATREIFGFGPEPVNSRSHMTWFPPSLLSFDVGSCLVGTPEMSGLCIPQVHLITPETALTSHYFFAVARNLKLEDASAGEKLFAALHKAFHDQDEPIIEAVQRSMGDMTDLDELNPVLLKTDSAPAMARRTLKRLIAAEAGQTAGLQIA